MAPFGNSILLENSTGLLIISLLIVLESNGTLPESNWYANIPIAQISSAVEVY